MDQFFESFRRRIERTNNKDEFYNIISKTFTKIFDYNNEVINEIRENVKVSDLRREVYVYTTLLKREIIEKYSSVLHPILNIETMKDTKLLNHIKNEKLFRYSTCFIKKSFNELKDFVESNRVLNGKVIDSYGKVYRFQFKLHMNEEFKNVEKQFYEQFYKNNIKWLTMNSPFVRKMFDINIVVYLDEIKNIKNVETIEFDFQELKPFVYMDYVPVWNINIYDEPCQSRAQKVIPFQDKIYYKYQIDIEDEASVFVDSEEVEISHIKRDNKVLEIYTEENVRPTYWRVFTFNDCINLNNSKSEFEILNNCKIESHTNFNCIPRTKGELNRIVRSFYCLKNFELKDLKIVNEYKQTLDLYNYNYFVEKGFIAYDIRKELILYFEIENIDYLTEDILSFIVSEIQLIFPEYKCSGVIA